MEFQQRLYDLRKKAGLSQEGLADLLGVTRQAVQKWEAGASRPDMDNLAALARYFNVTLDYLVTGEEPLAPAAQTTIVNNYYQRWRYEYKSQRTLFGLPLVHIRLGDRGTGVAKGVLAIGNYAVGIFTIGGFSLGLVSIGGLSVGLLFSLAGWAIGGIAVGGFAVGLLAIGGAAVRLGNRHRRLRPRPSGHRPGGGGGPHLCSRLRSGPGGGGHPPGRLRRAPLPSKSPDLLGAELVSGTHSKPGAAVQGEAAKGPER